MPEQPPAPPQEDEGLVGPPPTPVTAGHQKRVDTKKPDSLSARNQVKAQVLSDSLFERRANLQKAAGEPFGAHELSPTERKQQYTDMISSNQMLMSALAGAAIIGRDGRLRISTKMVDAFVELSGVKK